MTITRFEALGLLPDREYVVAHKDRCNEDGERLYTSRIFYDTLSCTDLDQPHYQFGLFEPYGFVIFIFNSFWLVADRRKAKRFLKRHRITTVDQYVRYDSN